MSAVYLVSGMGSMIRTEAPAEEEREGRTVGRGEGWYDHTAAVLGGVTCGSSRLLDACTQKPAQETSRTVAHGEMTLAQHRESTREC